MGKKILRKGTTYIQKQNHFREVMGFFDEYNKSDEEDNSRHINAKSLFCPSSEKVKYLIIIIDRNLYPFDLILHPYYCVF